MEVFRETLSRAQEKWRRAIFDEALAAARASGQAMLIDPEEIFRAEEELLAQQWEDRLEQNLRALLRDHERFIVRAKSREVFAGVEGDVRQSHLRKVLKKLYSAGVTSSNGVGDLYGKEVVRAPDAQP
jgi:hypothetical protein